MIYAKHPEKGNRHFPDHFRADLEAGGWVIWPRTKEQKEAHRSAPVLLPPLGEILGWQERSKSQAPPAQPPEVVSSPPSAPEPAAPLSVEKRPYTRRK